MNGSVQKSTKGLNNIRVYRSEDDQQISRAKGRQT